MQKGGKSNAASSSQLPTNPSCKSMKKKSFSKTIKVAEKHEWTCPLCDIVLKAEGRSHYVLRYIKNSKEADHCQQT